MAAQNLKIALLGNPNCGKTTLFNSLTGATAHVGNWPGVTVEKREGTYKNKQKDLTINVVDLPGIYSLSPYTPEEVISRDYIIDERPNVVVNVVDGTNLERNLYMTTQVLEMDVPVVVAVNMIDAVEKNNQKIDTKKLSEVLGVPVIAISALRQNGLDELMELVAKTARTARTGTSVLPYKKALDEITAKLHAEEVPSPLFHAVKLLEKDEIEEAAHPKLVELVAEITSADGVDYEASIADERYKWIGANCSSCITGRVVQEKKKLSVSDKIDRVLTNRWAAIPIFLVILFLIFHLTFSEDLFYLGAMGVNFGEGYPGFIHFAIDGEETYFFAELFWSADGIKSPGAILAGLTEGICTMITEGIRIGLNNINSPEMLTGFICDGALAGVFAVVGFLPQILVLFLFFSLLEDSGYMARVAFILDRIFRRLGISGRAILPMIMGFGCGVPAMINTRTLNTDKEKIKTIRVIPFFTCGAKAEILAGVVGVLAAKMGMDAGLITFGFYLGGMIVAFAAVIVMNFSTLREKVPPFIMELPAYHAPQFKALMIHIWDKAKHFLKKAFTIILVSTILIWFFLAYDWTWQPVENIQDSILANICQLIQPLFTPLGWGSQVGGFGSEISTQVGWVYSLASIQGLVAKEQVVSTLETVAGSAGYADTEALLEAANLSTGAFLSFVAFQMLTIPCFASVATAKSELPTRKSYLWTLAFWMGLSYFGSAIIYIIVDFPWTNAIVWPVAIAACVGLYFYNRHMNIKEKNEASDEAGA